MQQRDSEKHVFDRIEAWPPPQKRPLEVGGRTIADLNRELAGERVSDADD